MEIIYAGSDFNFLIELHSMHSEQFSVGANLFKAAGTN